ncbi:MAG: hypothetical protein JOZ37_05065, partial [Actinobacteria bacterium]|nr:hypothetical protein [Actinomycetota bacterium]
ARYSIAGVALVILIIAIAFSKRKTEAMDADISGAAGVPASDAGQIVEAAMEEIEREPVAVGATPARRAVAAKKAPVRKAPVKKAVPTKTVAKKVTTTAAKKRSAAAASARSRSPRG